MELGKFREKLSSPEVHRVIDPLIFSTLSTAKAIGYRIKYALAEFDVEGFGAQQLRPWEINVLDVEASPLSEMAASVDADRTLPTELL
jgi:hypothetical protein